jgi:hypothetical protein
MIAATALAGTFSSPHLPRFSMNMAADVAGRLLVLTVDDDEEAGPRFANCCCRWESTRAASDRRRTCGMRTFRRGRSCVSCGGRLRDNSHGVHPIPAYGSICLPNLRYQTRCTIPSRSACDQLRAHRRQRLHASLAGAQGFRNASTRP